MIYRVQKTQRKATGKLPDDPDARITGGNVVKDSTVPKV